MLPLYGGAGSRQGTSVASGARSVASLSRHQSSNATGSIYDDFYSRNHWSLFKYLRRVVYYPQMDFQYTFTQMKFLLHSPSRVYKLTSWRNQTKAQWARDDPAFVVMLCFFITDATVAYGLALGESASFTYLLWLIAKNILLFFVSGLIIATFWWWIANSYFRARHSHSVDQEVEWMYAFDIHCNGYWPLVLSLYVVQFFLMPFLLSHTFLATLVANTIYALTFSYYSYISFLGFMYLPFLNKTLVTSMLYPIGVVGITYVLFTVLNINATVYTLSFFFPELYS